MILRRIKRYCLCFIIGALGYSLIEIIWRGHTHWSMAIAGGLSFIAFSLVAEVFRDMPIIVKALIAAVAVTAIELLFGVIFNITLGMQVWDYSGMKFNFLGQICPQFSLMWVGLSLIFLPLADRLNHSI